MGGKVILEEKENMLKEIKNKKLFVLEGKDDVGFFVNLLDTIGIKDFFVWGVKGKDKYKPEMMLLPKISGFSKLTHLAIIRDKENDNALESVQGILTQLGFKNIPRQNGDVVEGKPTTGVFILPGNINGKMLEDLCLEVIKTDPAMRCINQFADCICGLPESPKNISKSKILAYLASRPEPVNTIGVAAQKGYWDMDSSALDELKLFLNKFK